VRKNAENTELSSFRELKGEAMKKVEMAETTRKTTSFALLKKLSFCEIILLKTR